MILTRSGLPILVDTADHAELSRHTWRVVKTGRKFYAQNGDGDYMHRMLLGLEPGDPRLGDHKNGCTVDNRRDNLRITTTRGNCYNMHFSKHNSTGFRGVTPYGQRFQARGRDLSGRRVGLGVFDTPEEAALAYAANFEMIHEHLMGAQA